VISDDLSPELQNLARERMLQLHHDGLQSPDLAVRIATIPKLRTDPPDLKVPWLLEAIVDEYKLRNELADRYQEEINATGGYVPIGGSSRTKAERQRIEDAAVATLATRAIVAIGQSALSPLSEALAMQARSVAKWRHSHGVAHAITELCRQIGGPEARDAARSWTAAVHECGCGDCRPFLDATERDDGLPVTIPSHLQVSDAQKAEGLTPLHIAAACNDIEGARTLLRSGANANAKKANDATPLHLAAGNNNDGMVRLLLEAGADPSIKTTEGYTPLGFALATGHLRAADAFKNAGVRS
jgi:hypothetical protein